MTSSHAGTPQARAKIHTTLTDFEIALRSLHDGGRTRKIVCWCVYFRAPGCGPVPDHSRESAKLMHRVRGLV